MGAIQYFILLSWGVVLLSDAAFDSNQDYYYYDDDADHCIIQHDYRTPYVTALNERVDVVAGCVSKETTPEDKEVHVINILQNMQRRGREDRSESAGATDVTLKLSPRKRGPGTVDHSRKLLLILNSEQPVIWHIQNEHMSNTTRHLFWISRNSRLYKESLKLKVKIKKKSMPHLASQLVQWVRNQSEAGVLTSYAEVQQPVINTIDFKVGIDASSPATCEGIYHPRPDVTASSLHTQKTNACMAVNNEGHHNRDVHIIEVHTSKNSPTGTTDIVLDIKAYDKKRRNRRLILVLKSHSNVKWKIHTKGIRGMVEIIADDQVDTNSVQVHSVSVAAERLTNIEGANLVTWTRERYGPAVSYTEATEANKFLLYIDGADHAPEVSIENAKHSPFDSPGRTRKAIRIAQSVDCRDEVLMVTLKKHVLRGIGVYKQHLSLLDESCLPRDNATHYIFESEPDACGTTVRQMGNDFVYENAVILHKVPDFAEGEEISGSGYDIASPDLTQLDDEDFPVETNVNVIRSDFICQKNANTKVLRPEFGLHLYKDERFRDRITRMEFPFSVESHSNIYLEATVRKDPRLHIIVQDCWVSGDKEGKMYMIINECQEFDVRQVVSSDPRVARFSIDFERYSEGKRGQRNIICGLSICNPTDEVIPKVEQCIPKPDCKKSPNFSDMSFKYWTEEEIGPLIVAGTRTNTPTDSLLPGNPLPVPDEQNEGGTNLEVSDSHPCGPPGLDSTTVVIIAFAAFIIGVLLVLALWLIYAKTVPRTPKFRSHHNPRYLAAKNSSQRARFAETSGESTPSSTAPITIHQVNHH